MRKQRGVAIIMAILIVALAATVASSLLWSQNVWTRGVESENDHAQAEWIALAGTSWAASILNNDTRNVDYLQEPWAQPLPTLSVENGEISGFIQDQQGLFNLNNLVQDGQTSEAEKANFVRLLGVLALPPELANALADWMDTDSSTQYPGGAESDYYLGLPQAYRAANQPLTRIWDLSRIRGFDRMTIEKLAPFVTVLPGFTPVNVNTAPPEVLVAVIAGLSLGEARALVMKRNVRYFVSTGDFLSRLPGTGFAFSEADISVFSQFFQVTANTHFGLARARIRTLLYRGSNLWPRTIWEQLS